MFEDYKYTISDIAKMTKLTDRTIRNYLAKGNLKGMKIGGQWRFSKNDIYALFNNDKFEDDMKQKTLQNIVDFFDSTDYETNHNMACCIFSLLSPDVKSFAIVTLLINPASCALTAALNCVSLFFIMTCAILVIFSDFFS